MSVANDAATRLTERPTPSTYAFEYRAGGTTVLDCVVDNRQFTGTVDLEAGVMTIDTGDADRGVVVTEDQAFLHRELFAPGAVEQEWLAVAPEAPAAELDLLGQAIGVDLAGYARPGGFVPGNQTAEAALEVAAMVETIDRATIDGAFADGFRLTLDADQLAEIDGSHGASSTASPRGADDVVPIVDFWIDGDGLVRRVEVHPATPPHADGEPGTVGWSIDYATTDAAIDVELPAPDATTLLTNVEPTRLALPPAEPCELGGT